MFQLCLELHFFFTNNLDTYKKEYHNLVQRAYNVRKLSSGFISAIVGHVLLCLTGSIRVTANSQASQMEL